MYWMPLKMIIFESKVMKSDDKECEEVEYMPLLWNAEENILNKSSESIFEGF